MKKKVTNYINNKTLYTHMIEHKRKLDESILNGTPKPQISNYIGEAIESINKNLIRKGNFSGYSKQWKDEMISDGQLDCIAAVDNFNPDRTNNPFSYFTQIAWNAFIRRISREKKQTYIKYKNFQNSYLMNEIYVEGDSIHMKSYDHANEIISSFENKLTKKKKNTKLSGLEVFQEKPDEE